MRLRILGATLVVMLVAGSCAPQPAPVTAALTAAHSAAMRDSVAATLATFVRLSTDARWDSLAAMYADTPEFRFLESGEIRYRSAAEVRAALMGIPAGTRIETTHRDTQIDPLAPGLAAASTLFSTTFVDSAGGRFTFGGALTMLFRHDSTGWRIVGGHSSSPTPRGS